MQANHYAFLAGILKTVFQKPIHLCKSDKIEALELQREKDSDQISPTESDSVFPYSYYYDETLNSHLLIIESAEIKPTLFSGIDPIAAFFLQSLSQLIVVYEFDDIILRGIKDDKRVFDYSVDFLTGVDKEGLIAMIEAHQEVHESILQQKKPA
jgi:hypothetical protein